VRSALALSAPVLGVRCTATRKYGGTVSAVADPVLPVVIAFDVKSSVSTSAAIRLTAAVICMAKPPDETLAH
jgi:hypothetical protein